ncbi:TonB-dependent receptor [Sphingobium algorifonticola]|uniref:TonB-dependent receptor n=1 Tax=Sphingobium algorifonticola TaxID=2008318 RepID=A0A437JCW7_9SPHN|nr:TonB-dependent receptor [Sphingobium algorifonticola]RVT43745.1 TonB-dependent receptor [Sphingobium algorifonticola]
MNKTLWLQTAGAAALMTVAICPAQAQDAVPQGDAPQAEAAGGNESDIIVTATRRASPLSDVPIAVSAVTAQSLQNSGASDIRQLNQLAPSLLVSSTGTEANGSARIRGIGTVGDNPGLESSVAVFIDGVYRSRTGAGLNELGEIERVEVLRGPQGTLFGRNASAGLLNIVSKKPEFELGGNAEITYGNYDYWRLAGRITGPITETIAASIDGVWSKRDGFFKLVDGTGNQVGETNNRDRYFLRGQLLLEPNDALSVRLIGDYTNRDESCCGAAYIETRERRPAGGESFTVAPFNRIVSILQGQGGIFPADPYDRELSITAGRNYVSKLKDWGVSGELNYDFGGATLTSITAYRDYKSQDYGDYDYGTADLLYRDPGTFRQFKTFTQELRLQGSAFSDKLDWLIGGYFANEKLTLRDNIRFGADYGRFAACRLMAGSGVNSNFTSAQLAACSSGAATTPLIAATQGNLNSGLTAAFIGAGLSPAAAAGQAGAISTGLGNGLRALAALPSGTGDVDNRYFQNSRNWAIFTHNIVHLTDRLDLTIGLRYTKERKRFSADLNNNNATCAALQSSSLPSLATNPALGSAQALAGGILTLGCLGNSSTSLNALDLNDRFSDGEFSGTGVLSWKPLNNLLTYASFSRGYKAGGYNLDRFQLGTTGTNLVPAVFSPRSNADVTSLRFAAEKVDAYELGLKFTQPKWSINVAAFRQEFKNFQLNTFNGTGFVVQNINGCDAALTTGSTAAGGGRCASDDVAPGLISQGVELEMSASPVRNVRVTGGLTYTRAKFANRLVGSSNGQVPLDPALFLLPGNTNSNAPELVTTGSFAWTPDIGTGGLSALFYIDGRLTSDYNTGSDLFPEKEQDGFAIFNARVGIRGPDQKWAVEFWGQNIFNTDYTQVAFSSPLQSSSPATSSTGQFRQGAPMANQLISAYLAEPRTYGITLRGKF